VVAIQHGKAIFSLSASFQKVEEGLEYQDPIPEVTQPQDLPGKEEMREAFLTGAPDHIRSYWERERPIEVRPLSLEHYISDQKLEPSRRSGSGPPVPCRMTGSSRRRSSPICRT
jgi:acyl-CoA thioesterase-2